MLVGWHKAHPAMVAQSGNNFLAVPSLVLLSMYLKEDQEDAVRDVVLIGILPTSTEDNKSI